MKRCFEVYRGRDGMWYWRLWAGNGRVIADGSEGYAKSSNARRAAYRHWQVAMNAKVVVSK